jgi:hypothetical protein
MKRLMKLTFGVLIVLLTGVLALTLWASTKVGTTAAVAAEQAKAKAASYPLFEFRGLRMGTPLEEAKAKGVVADCAKITDYVACRLTKDAIGEVAIWQSYVDFSEGKLDTFMIDINSDWFDQLVTNLRSAYGEPCGSDTKKLQNAYGATFDGDELWWCFSDGNMVLRRHNKEDFRKAGLVFERFEAPKRPATFTSDTL